VTSSWSFILQKKITSLAGISDGKIELLHELRTIVAAERTPISELCCNMELQHQAAA